MSKEENGWVSGRDHGVQQLHRSSLAGFLGDIMNVLRLMEQTVFCGLQLGSNGLQP